MNVFYVHCIFFLCCCLSWLFYEFISFRFALLGSQFPDSLPSIIYYIIHFISFFFLSSLNGQHLLVSSVAWILILLSQFCKCATNCTLHTHCKWYFIFCLFAIFVTFLFFVFRTSLYRFSSVFSSMSTIWMEVRKFHLSDLWKRVNHQKKCNKFYNEIIQMLDFCRCSSSPI